MKLINWPCRKSAGYYSERLPQFATCGTPSGDPNSGTAVDILIDIGTVAASVGRRPHQEVQAILLTAGATIRDLRVETDSKIELIVPNARNSSDIFVQQRLRAVCAELAAVRVRKEGRCASFPGLSEPAAKGLLCDLCDCVLCSLRPFPMHCTFTPWPSRR